MYKRKPFLLFLKGSKVAANHIKAKNYFASLKKENKMFTYKRAGGTKSAELIRNLILKDYFNEDKNKNLINILIHYFI